MHSPRADPSNWPAIEFDRRRTASEERMAVKPGSVKDLSKDDHLSRTAIARCLKRSTRMDIDPSRAKSTRYRADAILFDLAPDGVYLASQVTLASGELLPHRFTLTQRKSLPRLSPKLACIGRFTFCGTSPWPYDRSALPTIPLCGARTFL